MHRHFTDAGSSPDVRRRVEARPFAQGLADEHSCKTIKDRVVIDDLHATIYRTLGISPKLSYEIEKAPRFM